MSPVLKYGKTEAALQNFEAPLLRAEVLLVIAETGPVSGKCKDFFGNGAVGECLSGGTCEAAPQPVVGAPLRGL